MVAYLSVYLYICQSVHLFVYISLFLRTCLFIYLFVYPSVSIYLLIYFLSPTVNSVTNLSNAYSIYLAKTVWMQMNILNMQKVVNRAFQCQHFMIQLKTNHRTTQRISHISCIRILVHISPTIFTTYAVNSLPVSVFGFNFIFLSQFCRRTLRSSYHVAFILSISIPSASYGFKDFSAMMKMTHDKVGSFSGIQEAKPAIVLTVYFIRYFVLGIASSNRIGLTSSYWIWRSWN